MKQRNHRERRYRWSFTLLAGMMRSTPELDGRHRVVMKKSFTVSDLPALSIQQRISQEVKSRRDQSKRLKQEAKEVVEKAKEEVERMILGEGTI